MTRVEVLSRYEQMAAAGTAGHPAHAWRTMAALLTETALVSAPGLSRGLFDRADDCIARAARLAAIANYGGCIGEGFRRHEHTARALDTCDAELL